MNIQLADRLVQLRKENGYSQEALAEKLGLSRQSISKWERAEASPDTDNLIALAKVYSMSLDELLGNTDEPEEADEKKPKEKKPLTPAQLKGKKILKAFPVIAIGIVILYIVLGFAFKLWHPMWMLFLVIPMVLATALALLFGKTKRITALALTVPVALATVVLFLIAGFALNAWAVAWVVFLIIPIYAYIAFLKTK